MILKVCGITNQADATAAVDAIRNRFGKSAVGAASMVTEDGVQVPARRDAPWGPDD